MKTFKKIMNLVPLMLFWLMITAFFWSWIFTFLTDAPREEKIVLFIECNVPGDTYIASRLEEVPSETIRLVQVRPFSYSMMTSEGIRSSDLYIVSESSFEEYSEWFIPLPKDALNLGETFLYENKPYGIKVFDKETNAGILTDYVGCEYDHYYLVFGKESLHLENGEALFYANQLFSIR